MKRSTAQSRLADILEPRPSDDGEETIVGDFVLPSCPLLTALLYGFGNHEHWAKREYYFWRICDELWNDNPRLAEPMMVRHPWAVKMIRKALMNKYLAVGGAASSGKSHTMAAWGIVNWMANPSETLVMITSTTLQGARKRIWGSVISLMSVVENAPCRVRDSIGSIAYVDAKGQLFDRAGLFLIAAEKKRTREASGKFIGIKQKHVILIGDELSEISEAVMDSALTNLSKNPKFQFIGMSNPNSRFDAFGQWSEPKGGWESVNSLEDHEWNTRWGGLYIRLDGERSPNILAGREIFPWLPTEEKLQEDKALLGENSRGYMRMVRAVFFDSDEADGVYSELEISSNGGMSKAMWQSHATPVAGLDPAFTNGGDRCILYFGLVGYDETGQYVVELGEAVHLSDDVTDKTVPRTYQIVRQVIKECQKRGVRASNVGVDSTGAGGPFCDVLAGEWNNEFLRISFGSVASEKRVSSNSKKLGMELFVNRVTELWFIGKELLRTRQIKGITAPLAKEMAARQYDMTKGSGNLRMRLESKAEFKARFGESPDLADGAFIMVDVARERLGLVPVDPPEEAPSGMPRPRPRTMANLQGALQADHACLPD